MEDAVNFLEVYAAFIKDRQALAEIDKAQKTIEGTAYLYETLLSTIKPAVNSPAPFTIDPYAPFSRGT